MENKKIGLISALVLALAALPTLGCIVAVYPNPHVLHHIDAQILIACFGAVSAILLRPTLRDRRQRWRNKRAAPSATCRQSRPGQEHHVHGEHGAGDPFPKGKTQVDRDAARTPRKAHPR